MTKPALSASLIKDVAVQDSPLKTKGALTIIADQQNEALPLDLLLVLDVSGSMKGQGVSVLSDSTVHILNNLMREEDRIAIITFNSGASLHTSWTNVNGYGHSIYCWWGNEFRLRNQRGPILPWFSCSWQ